MNINYKKTVKNGAKNLARVLLVIIILGVWSEWNEWETNGCQPYNGTCMTQSRSRSLFENGTDSGLSITQEKCAPVGVCSKSAILFSRICSFSQNSTKQNV